MSKNEETANAAPFQKTHSAITTKRKLEQTRNTGRSKPKLAEFKQKATIVNRSSTITECDSDLPEPFEAVHRVIDEIGTVTDRLAVQIVNFEGDAELVLLDIAQLIEGKYNDLVKLVNKFNLFQYAGPRGLRELATILLRSASEELYVATHEGYHGIHIGAHKHECFVWRNAIHELDAKLDFAVQPLCETMPPQPSCTLHEWNAQVGRHLYVNTYALVCFCIAIMALLTSWLNLPRLIIVLVGPSSKGKNTLQQALQSMIEPAADIQSASGTTKGIRTHLEQFFDRPAFLDELRQAEDMPGLVSLLFDLGNGASRLTSSADQQSKKSAPLRCGLILSNESMLAEMLSGKKVLLNEGLSARFFELVVDDEAGVFQNLPDDFTAKAFSELLKNNSAKYYGAFWDAWVLAVSKAYVKVKSWADRKIPELEAELIEGFDINDAVTRRMVRSLATAAFAGCVASKLKLIPLTEKPIVVAFRQVLKEHLERQRHRTTSVGEQVINAVRDVIDRERSRFVPLADMHRNDHSGLYGYRRTTKKESTYLFLPSVFEELIGSRFGTAMAASQLRRAGYLDADVDGNQKQIRVPGINGKKEVQKRFYAIRDSIRFDAD